MAAICIDQILDIGTKRWQGNKDEVGKAPAPIGAPQQFMLPSVDNVRAISPVLSCDVTSLRTVLEGLPIGSIPLPSTHTHHFHPLLSLHSLLFFPTLYNVARRVLSHSLQRREGQGLRPGYQVHERYHHPGL